MRDIETCFDNDATPVGKLDAQHGAHWRSADQINGQKLIGWSCCSTGAFQMSIVIQRMHG